MQVNRRYRVASGQALGSVDRRGWRASAACRWVEPELFFAAEGQRWDSPEAVARVEAAKAVCAGCPVHRECLAWAMATGERYGVWGGLSDVERLALLVPDGAGGRSVAGGEAA